MDTLTLDVGRAFYGRFASLLPAQQEAVAPLLRGDDVLVLSGTGSGKTEAVTAPLVQRYRAVAMGAAGCTIVYVTPTRALAHDLLRRLEPPLAGLGLSVGIRHGERNDLARHTKPTLLITTPESLDVLVTSRTAALHDVRAVVLDEVHLTYNSQRGLQLAILLRRLEHLTGRPFQAAGLSATIADPADVWQFFRPGHPVVAVRDDRQKPLAYQIRQLDGETELVRLLDLVATGRQAKVLLFANSRRVCDRLGADLRGRTVFGERVFVHHASLDRAVRLQVEEAFQESGSALCVATSTLELGIDIGDVDLIVLYGHPGGWESFVQRVGRGNRRADHSNVLCLLPPDDGPPFLSTLAFEALAQQVQRGRLEREPPLRLYGAAAQQLLTILLERRGAYRRMDELIIPFAGQPHLDRPAAECLLKGLERGRFVRRHPVQHRYGAGPALHLLHRLRLVWGNFPARSQDVTLTAQDRPLGTVPASNLVWLEPGEVVRFAGRHWRVRHSRPDAVQVEECGDPATVEIAYESQPVPLDPTNVEAMLQLLEAGTTAENLAAAMRHDFLDTFERVRRYAGWQRLPVACEGDTHWYFTFAGRMVNTVIAHWAGLYAFSAGDVALRCEGTIDFAALPDVAALQPVAGALEPDFADLTIFQGALPRDLLAAEMTDRWGKTPVFARSLNRLRQAALMEAPLEDVGELIG